MYIEREIDSRLHDIFSSRGPNALILAGIVGCGKTTAVQRFLHQVSAQQSVFSFTGDDVRFRTAVANDTMYLVNHIRGSTQGPAIVFVDEVQKSDAVFDALKVCFDSGISFIVSGSNPAYLSSTARKRLQRRADFLTMAPFSLPELMRHHGFLDMRSAQETFLHLLDRNTKPAVPNLGLRLTADIKTLCQHYLTIGGLPMAHLEERPEAAMRQIRSVVERGFEVIEHDNKNLSDAVRTYLAENHSREFAYQGIMQRTGIHRRDDINAEIRELLGHAYLHSKRPTLMGEDRRSYLCVYSYADPGVVSYLSGDDQPSDGEMGFRMEGVIRARLEFLRQFLPLKSDLAYYKPFTVDQNNKTKFLPGEIDFVYSRGKRHIPIEVKLTSDISGIDVKHVEAFIRRYHAPYGMILYGGAPQVSEAQRLIFWPYWAV
jgi:predicted AAA+ superfamily ATPase